MIMTAIAPDATIDMVEPAAWILIATAASSNGNATAWIAIEMDASRDGSEIAMVATIGAMTVTAITDIETVSIGKLRTIEYSRISKRGRSMAVARVFIAANL
jgi:hypothetical protein